MPVTATLKGSHYDNIGNEGMTKVTSGASVNSGGNGNNCSWGDYDNNGDGSFNRVTDSVVSTEPSASFSAGWADYDNDGFPDLFVTNSKTYNNALYRNNGNNNAWLTLKLEGRQSNRAAIGAKVRVRATMAGKVLWQLREISGGGGLGSQNDLRAGFGLGDARNAEVVRVEWPSGIVQELHDVAPKQFLTIIESSASISPPI